MPLLRVQVAVTIDGYIARDDGSFDYLEPFGEAYTGWDAFFASIGSVIMGRTMYEQAAALDRWFYADKRTFVLTSRPLDDPRVEAFSDPVELVARLKREESLDIWHMGGGLSIEPFERAGLIDRWELAIVPIRLGSGIPLFRSGSDLFSACELTRCEQCPLGMVMLHYEPKRNDSTH